MAFIKSPLYFDGIRPVLEVRGTALIGISSPMDEENFFVRMTQFKRDDGKPFFRVMHVSIVCDACKLLPKEQAMECDHRNDLLPPWKDPKIHKRSTRLFDAFGRGTSALRENKGMVVSDRDYAFDHGMLRSLFEAKAPFKLSSTEYPGRWCAPADVPVVWTCVDLCDGGSSHMAVASVVYVGLTAVVSVFLAPLSLAPPLSPWLSTAVMASYIGSKRVQGGRRGPVVTAQGRGKVVNCHVHHGPDVLRGIGQVVHVLHIGD